MRTPTCALSLTVLLAAALPLGACTRSAAPESGTAASVSGEPASSAASAPGPGAGATQAVEPIRLPFPDAAGVADPEFVFTTAQPSGCRVTYQRWWGTPDRPGSPIVRVRVRSAMFAGAGGATPIDVLDDGEQRVFRRGPASDRYQANLIFESCTEPEVDAVLAQTQVTLTAPLGTQLPDAVDVCVGAQGSLTRRRVVPSRAGVFDPAQPIQGEHLNWMGAGVGCVTYPALSGAVTCEGASLPWVATTRCQQ
jgi:hypothetical protein